MADITIIYCAADGCDTICASGGPSLNAASIVHRVHDDNGKEIAQHDGGLILRISSAAIDRSSYANVDEYHLALQKTYPKEKYIDQMQTTEACLI